MEVTIVLLLRWRADNVRLADLLRAVCALLAHRRFAEAFVATGGLAGLLALPLNPHTAGAQQRASARSTPCSPLRLMAQTAANHCRGSVDSTVIQDCVAMLWPTCPVSPLV